MGKPDRRLEAVGLRTTPLRPNAYSLKPKAFLLRASVVIFFLPAGCGPSARKEPPEPPPIPLAPFRAIERAEARGGAGDGTAILDSLRDPDPRVRARAARAAGRWGPERWRAAALPPGSLPRALPPGLPEDLPDLLGGAARSDPDPQVRREAIFALGQLGAAESSALLLALASDPKSEIRASAVEAIGKISGTSSPALLPGLSDGADVVRGAAAIALARLSGDGPGERDNLAAALAARLEAEEVEDVRWKLAYLASRLPALLEKAEVRSRLLASLGRPNFIEAAFAADALRAAVAGSGGVPSWAAEAVREAAARAAEPDRFWPARVACIRLLAAVLPARSDGASPAADAAEDSIARLANSPRFPGEIHHVRRAVLESLGKCRRRGAGALEAAIRSVEEGDLPAAVRGAASFPELLPLLVGLPGAKGAGARAERLRAAIAGARCAARTGDRAGGEGPGGEVAEAALADPSPRVRAAAIEALPDPPAAILERGLSDPEPSVRGAAAARIAKAALPPEAIARAYRDSLPWKFWEVRADLVPALEAARDAKVLREALADPHPTVALRAAAALARLGEAPDPAAVSGALFRMPLADPAGEPRLFSATDRGSRDPVARIRVRDRGEFLLRLAPGDAPQAVAAFLDLARKGFHDGLTFHRVVPGWVVQGGDPRGDGWGDAGFCLRDETSPAPFLRGSVGIAKVDRDDGSCQFFVTHLPAPSLDGRFTLLGRVIEGMETVDRIEEGDAIESVEADNRL
jgi:cyclophilin family peptidyl-prolyl cis-trans isomerase